MTRNEIIKMVWEAASIHATSTSMYVLAPNQLEHFISLVSKRQQKDLLEALEQIAWSNDSQWQADCAKQAIAKAKQAQHEYEQATRRSNS